MRPTSGPALEAVRAGAKVLRARKHQALRARKHDGKQIAAIHASRVAARSPGLAAFYAGLEKALARPADSADAPGPGALWPVDQGHGGVLSRTGALALAVALLALALLLAFAVVPRQAAVRVFSGSRVSGRAARESLVLTLGTAAVCAFLAVLLVRAAL